MSLNGKAALVTGAGRGIGRAIALALADATSALVARSERELSETTGMVEVRGGKALPLVADLKRAGRATGPVTCGNQLVVKQIVNLSKT